MINQIFEKLNTLGAVNNNYNKICKVYITAKLIITFTTNGVYGETMRCSRELRGDLHKYRDAVSEVGEENFGSWEQLCTALQCSGLDIDYRLFFALFAPNIVENWDGYLRQFNGKQPGKMLLALTLLTSYVGEDVYDMSSKTMRERYNRYSKLYRECGLDLDAFDRCWHSVHFAELADSEIEPKQAIIDAMEVYHSQFLPMTDLLDDYATLRLDESVVSKKTALKGGRRKRRTSKLQEGGRPTTDEELKDALLALATETPTDVVRGLFYRGRNDAGFECTYLLGAFSRTLTFNNKILIVNPAPDFLVCWMDKSILCEKVLFAVTDDTVAAIYKHQFAEREFVAMSKLGECKGHFDRILIMARDTPAETVLTAVSFGTPDAQIVALMPESAMTSNMLQAVLNEHNYHTRKIIPIPTAVTQSEPRKKVLAFADNTWSADYFHLLASKCDDYQTVFSTEKGYYPIPYSWLDGSMTIADMRKKWTQAAKAHSPSRAEARIYSWSPEIKLRFTIQQESPDQFAGRVYYRSLLRPNQKHRKSGDRLTDIIEKGLRKNTEAEVIAALETAALDDRIAPKVAEDILDYYTGRWHGLSLKTVWYCLRARLAEEASYNEELAIHIFCGSNQDLATLSIVSSPDEYDEAMSSLFPDDVPVKYWRQLELILRVAKHEHYINHNPIQGLMPEISKRLSKRQQQVRNEMAKKQFETDEEVKMVTSLLTSHGSKEELFLHDSMWMVGLIRMFAIPDIHQLCALRWMDFEEIWKFGSYQFHISRYLTDKGSIKPIIDMKRELYRDVPVAPFLAELLLEYKQWLKIRYNLTDDQLALCPIVMEDHSVLKHGASITFCDLKKARKKCATMIDSAEIPTNELVLPSSDTGDKTTDLNTVYHTVFQTNLKNHLRHVCGFTEGELAYMLGMKAPDTFSAHYCDYGHVVLQHRMAVKLVRWTGRYSSQESCNSVPHWGQTAITGAIEQTHKSSANALAHISLLFNQTGCSKISGTLIELSSRYGIKGFAACIGKEKKYE